MGVSLGSAGCGSAVTDTNARSPDLRDAAGHDDASLTDTGVPVVAHDVGTPHDVSVVDDGGPALDIGAHLDAGATQDVARPPDVSANPDTGTATDVGAHLDAGADQDVGTHLDAGPVHDTSADDTGAARDARADAPDGEAGWHTTK